MRIGINCRPLFPGRIGGLEHYFRGLLSAMLELGRDHEYLLYCHDENLESLRRYEPGARLWRLRDPHRLENLARAVRDSAPDAVFHPFLFIEPMQLDAINVIHIPDLRYRHFPEQIPPEVMGVWSQQFPESARRAEAILTLSRFSRDDLAGAFDLDPARIGVASPGVEARFFEPVAESALAETRARLGLPERFIYYPADTWPHKNHARLFEALALLNRRSLRVPLVLSGFPNAGEDAVVRALRDRGLEGQVRRPGYLTRADLPAVYRLADALVFPSMFEGWGMPVSEAMACGAAVACSRAASIPEVGGELPLYFDPLDAAGMAECIERLWTDEALRRELRARGPAHARAQGWAPAARATLDAIERAARPMVEACDPLPLVTIVTPSYNQGRFIERTIESVLNQDYPFIEYLVLDGGSKDETVDILKKYSHRLRWISRKDRGQSDAINQGLKAARGEILAYLNSDDTYTPGAVRRAVAHLAARPSCDLVYGRGWHIDADDKVLEPYPTEPFDAERLASRCFICQPTAFWRRRLHDRIGYFDEDVHFVMDYEFWMRAAKVARIAMLDDYQANSRLWEENKTLGSRGKHLYQSLEVVHRHYGRVPMHWIQSYAGFAMEEKWRARGLPKAVATPLRRWRRQWLIMSLDGRFNGWDQVMRKLTRGNVGESLEGFADGWVGPRFEKRVRNGGAAGRLRIEGELPGWPAGRPPSLRVRAAGRPLGEFALTGPGPFVAEFPLPTALGGGEEIPVRVDASAAFVPSRLGIGEDDRRLSWRVASLSVLP